MVYYPIERMVYYPSEEMVYYPLEEMVYYPLEMMVYYPLEISKFSELRNVSNDNLDCFQFQSLSLCFSINSVSIVIFKYMIYI